MRSKALPDPDKVSPDLDRVTKEVRALADSDNWRDRYLALRRAVDLPEQLQIELSDALAQDTNQYVRALSRSLLSGGSVTARRRSNRALVADLNGILRGTAVTSRQRAQLVGLLEETQIAGAIGYLGLAADRAATLVTASLNATPIDAPRHLQQLELFLRHVASYARPEAPPRILGPVSQAVQWALRRVELEPRTNFEHEDVDVNLGVARGVLDEIGRNAADASASTISIDSVIVNGHVILTVENDGEPIPAEDKQHVFDPWYTTKPGHAGLGLFLARHRVEEAGGTVRLTSVEKRRFELALPYVDG
jgi:signal transduction histidine kinase